MAKTKKQAKTAHKAHKTTTDEMAVSKMVAITGGIHRMVLDGQGKTKCGQWGTGWKYGVAEEVLCEGCSGE